MKSESNKNNLKNINKTIKFCCRSKCPEIHIDEESKKIFIGEEYIKNDDIGGYCSMTYDSFLDLIDACKAGKFDELVPRYSDS